MPVNRFFLPFPLIPGPLLLPQEESHHLSVLRVQPNDLVEIADGEGNLATATLLTLGKKNAEVMIQEVHHTLPPPHRLGLYQAYIKGNKLSFMVEKAVELGASEIFLYPSEKGEELPKEKEASLERLKNVAIAALKQSGGLYLPKIKFISPIQQWHKENHPPLFYGDPRASKTLLHALSTGSYPHAYLVIGPESGFSRNEEYLLTQLNAIPILLHHHILRTETAGIVGLSIYYQIQMEKTS